MVILKRITSSTLMETLVATVLIIIIFMITSMLLNSIFVNSSKRNNNKISTRLHQLQYQFGNGKIPIPYYQEEGEWEISVIHENDQGLGHIIFKATNITSQISLKQT